VTNNAGLGRTAANVPALAIKFVFKAVLPLKVLETPPRLAPPTITVSLKYSVPLGVELGPPSNVKVIPSKLIPVTFC
jgi:hypothetical protein